MNSEKNREILKNEINFCEKNKHLLDCKKQNIIKDPDLFLSRISENTNEDIPTYNNSMLPEEKIEWESNNKNCSNLSETQIKSLMEIVKQDYIPNFNGNGMNVHDESSLQSKHSSVNIPDVNDIKEKRITLPLQIYEFDEEKGEIYYY